MQQNPFLMYFPFLASIGILFTCWGTIKVILLKIFNLFIIEVEVSDIAGDVIQRYINKNKLFKLGKFIYAGKEEYINPIQRKGAVIHSLVNREPQICFIRGKPLFILNKNGMDKAEDKHYKTRISFYFIRFTFNIEKLLTEAVNEYNIQQQINNKRFFCKQIYGFGKQQIINKDSSRGYGIPEDDDYHKVDYFTCKPLIWKPENIGYGSQNKQKTIENYVFCDATNQLLKSIEVWKKSEQWYRDRNILYRKGALLYGKPGSGKSSCIRTICQYLDLPLYIFDLASLSNHELIEKWQQCQETQPCAVLFEDLDGIYNKRELINPEIGPSFDCLLNCMSGALPAEGMFIFATTNNIDMIDSALGVPDKTGITSRGGRLDLMIELNNISEPDRVKLAHIILKGYEEYIPELVKQTENFTASQCVEVFSKKALELYWVNK